MTVLYANRIDEGKREELPGGTDCGGYSSDGNGAETPAARSRAACTKPK